MARDKRNGYTSRTFGVKGIGMVALLGIRVSAKEVSKALHKLVPAARAFLNRRLDDRKWMYLYVDGTNFRVRRSTVGIEPTLVVLGVDETGRKSVLSMVHGDRDSRAAWESVFVALKERGVDIDINGVILDLQTPTTGSLTTQIAIPQLPSLVGVTFLEQVVAIEFDPMFQWLEVTSSNGLVVTVGGY